MGMRGLRCRMRETRNLCNQLHKNNTLQCALHHSDSVERGELLVHWHGVHSDMFHIL